MKLELHHFFILVKPGAVEAARSLASIGMIEGTSRSHEGQGTANRRFHFSNGTLELLWVRDEADALHGPGRDMCLAQRATDPTASPFGLMFNRMDSSDSQTPFHGWKYQPDYFQPPMGFHIGANSADLIEPLCIYMPFVEPGNTGNRDENPDFKSITTVKVHTPAQPFSPVLTAVQAAERLSIAHGGEHLMEVTFSENANGQFRDFRPVLPLTICW